MENWGRVVVMLPIAIAASVFILWLAWREGWTQRPGGRIAAGCVCYVLLLIAYPPPVAQGLQVASMLAGLVAGAAMMVVAWVTGGKAQGPRVGQAINMQSEILFEDMEGDNGDEMDIDGWVVVPVDGDDGGLHDDGRRTDRGSEVPGADGAGSSAGADEAGNGVAKGAANPASNRSGRGRRLSGAVVPG